MVFQSEVGSGVNRATDYRDLVVKLVAMATSQHAATVAVNAGGTGYVVGDIVTLTHAGAIMDARFEVTTVSGGVITGLEIRDYGAFSNRITSAVAVAGGSGYVVGDVLELQGGSARENGKVQVATLSGSAVATVTVFETGGAYTTAPSAADTTVGIGPAAFAGDDAATITATMTGMIGTTGLSVTGGTGSSATVNITLAETGWAAERNTNSRTENSLTNEKEVVLKGDHGAFTNKPFIGFVTASATSGLDTRYGAVCFGMAAHNASTDFGDQIGLSPGMTSGSLVTGAPQLNTPVNQAQEIDFWVSVTDKRLVGAININPAAASTDSGVYLHFHLGMLNAFGTELENPYPMMIGASSRLTNHDPVLSTQQISGMAECNAPSSSSPGWYTYVTESAAWVAIENTENLNSNIERTMIMYPIGQVSDVTTPASAEIVRDGTYQWWKGIATTSRAVPSSAFLPAPGSSPVYFPVPLTVLYRAGGSSLDEDLDTVRGEVDGVFWISGSTETEAAISDFSEDTITMGGEKHRVFHNHVHHQRYHFICIRES